MSLDFLKVSLLKNIPAKNYLIKIDTEQCDGDGI